jgi:hypothetical protein
MKNASSVLSTRVMKKIAVTINSIARGFSERVI